MSFNILYKSLFLIHKVLVWFSSLVKLLLGGWELFLAVWKAKRYLLEDAKGWSWNCLCAATSFLSAICRICLFLFLIRSFTCQLWFPYEKCWFLVVWPLLRQSLALCGLIEPYSFISLLEEVCLLMKWRVLWHQCLSQENALSISWPNQPCLAGSSFLSWKAQLSHTVSWCWLVLAESPDNSWLSREARQLSTEWRILHQIARVSWQRWLCCSISGYWGRRWQRWDSAGSAATRGPVWRVEHSQPLLPKGRAVMVTMFHNAAFNSEKYLGWVLWRVSITQCMQLAALFSSHWPPI